ncbi:MAG: hypothetical protein PHP08_00205 [Candidatus Dojkabacteria bacterium]|nr:hypothetical protein [Candidatus Dojkabacteria bacterium]
MDTTTEEYVGGFLMIEGAASIIFSGCKSSTSQLGRLLRIGIGYYIYSGRLE